MSGIPNAPANSLLPYLAGFFLAPFVKSGVVWGRYVQVGHCVVAAQVAFETGALLGYHFRERFPVFVKLFCEPGKETELANYLKELARSRMASCQVEGMTFFNLRWQRHVDLTMEAMRRAGLTNITDPGAFHLIAQERIRLTNVARWLSFVTSEGIGLGAGLPQITEALWRNSFELPMGEEDLRDYHLMRTHGLDVPETPPRREMLHEAEARAVSYIVPYVSHHCPEMLKELGL